MIKIGDIILTINKGIGKAVFIDFEKVGIEFDSKEVLMFLLKFENISLFVLEPEITNAFLSNSAKVWFNSVTVGRSKFYLSIDSYDNFSIDKKNNTISANIFGSRTYSVSFNYKTLDCFCSCPVDGLCKHECAFIQVLTNQLNYAINLKSYLNDDKNNGQVKLIPSLIVTLDFFNKNDLDVYALLNLKNYLKDREDDIQQILSNISVYDFVDDFKLRLVVDMFFCVFDYSLPLLRKFVIFNGKNKNISAIRDEYQLIENFITNGTFVIASYTFCFVNCLVKNKLNTFFDYINANNNASFDMFLIKNMDKILLYYKKETPSVIFYYIALAILTNKNSKNFDYSKQLIDSFAIMSPEEKKLISNQLPNYVYQMIDLHDFAVYFNEFPNIVAKCQHFLSNISRFTDEEIGYVGGSVASNFCSNSVTMAERNMLKTVLSRLPYDSILKKYIKNDYPSSIIYTELGNEKPSGKIDEKAFNYYFKYSYDVTNNEKTGFPTINYYLKFYNGINVATVETNNNEENSWIVFDHIDDGFGNYEYVNYFIWKIKNFDEKHKVILDKIAVQKENIANEINDKKLNDTFDKITSDVISGIRKNNSKTLVKALYFFDFSSKSVTLSMKIGIGKYYQVTGFNNFLQHLNNGEQLIIGKELSFVNCEENYNPKDYSIFKFLSFYVSIDFSTISRNKLKLSEEFLFMLLDRLKGEQIYINNFSCNVRLEEKIPEIDVMKDYKICLSDKDLIIYKFDDSDLILDQTTGILDILKRNQSYKRLIDAIDKNCNDISRVKKNFIDKVYPNFVDKIHVDEAIKNDFVISKIEINSYFDFYDGCISLETKINKGRKNIEENEITDSYDFSKMTLYNSLIEQFGFVKGYISSQSDILNFLNADFTDFKKISNVYLSETIQKKQISVFKPPRIKMTFENNIMKVFVDKSEYSNADLYAILEAIKLKKIFVLLKDNRIVSLDDKSIDFADTIDALKLNTKDLDKPKEKPIYQSLKAFENIDDFSVDSYLDKMVKDISNFKNSDIAVPQINGNLKPYQIEGYKWLKTLANYKLGGILADDMGLGKTLEIISLLKSDKTEQPILIVSPKSLLYNWKSEFEKFDDGNEIVMIYGTSDHRKELIKNIDNNKRVIYLTSFDSLRNDSKLYKTTFNYIVLDEAQYIKNVHALKTQNVKTLIGTHKFALTGTPIENDIFDLWSIFDFLMPDYLPSIHDFTTFANDEHFQKRIAKYVAPFILRRTKKEVLKELPPKYEHIVTAEMDGEQRKLYDATCLKANDVLKSGGKAFDVLYLLTRLRQICVDPHTFIDNYEGKSSKTEMIIEIVQDYIEKGHKILIFSQFVKALSILEKYFIKLGINYLVLTGETSSEKRIEYVNKFNKNKQIKVFLISLKAGGNGLNLTGADTVIHYDPWWNVAAENQATDRAYRIGQNKNVEVIKLIMQDSVEQRVIELQNKKKDLIDKLISDDDSSITKVSVDDLKFILK